MADNTQTLQMTYQEEVEAVKKYYADLLILQYRNKPKARETIKLGAELYLGDGLVFDLQDILDIDKAEGKQLDIIGKILDCPRTIQGLDIDKNYFAFAEHPQFDLSKFTVVGNPTINEDGVASGFSNTSNLKCTPYTISNITTIEGKCIVGNQSTSVQQMFSSNYGFRAELYKDFSRASFFGYTNTKMGVPISLDTPAQAGDLLEYKVTIDIPNATQTVNLTINGKTYTKSTKGSVTTSPIGQNVTMAMSNLGYIWQGSIDLSSIRITVDGQEVFSGVKPKNPRKVGYSVIGNPKNGIFRTVFSSSLSQYALLDEDYRTLLKFKALLNVQRADMATMDDNLYNLFGGNVILKNNQNLTINYVVASDVLISVQAALKLDYLQAPIGVGYEIIIHVPNPQKIFGYKEVGSLKPVAGFSRVGAPKEGTFLTRKNILNATV